MPKRFVACAEFEDTITNYGEGDSRGEAMLNFMDDAFVAHCEERGIPAFKHVEVKVFATITPESPEWDDDVADPDWQWMLGEELYSTTVISE